MSTQRDDVFSCELWTGRTDKDGYGFHGRSRAHVVAWEKANGPRPLDKLSGEPLQLDHWCRRPACCNVRHLEPVTRRENQLRKSWSYRAALKRCQFGHSLEHALVTPEMGRLCRTCARSA